MFCFSASPSCSSNQVPSVPLHHVWSLYCMLLVTWLHKTCSHLINLLPACYMYMTNALCHPREWAASQQADCKYG
eukprot:jgi/Chrzof1/8061/UNPLg00106.t1